MRPRTDRAHEWWFLWLAAVLFGATSIDRGGGRVDWSRGPRSDRAVRLMTWNVGSSGGERGGAMSDEWIDAVAAVIRAADADLVALQELRDRGQAERLVARLGDGWVQHATRRGRRLALLARDAGLEVRTLDVSGDRDFLLGSYVGRAGALTVAVVHADAYSSRLRNRQLGETARWLRATRGRQVLVGDLNLDLDLGKRSDLFSDDEHLDVETYNHLTQRTAEGSLVDVGVGAGSTAEPDRRLDYVFAHTRGLAWERVGVLGGVRSIGMDHDPLLVDLLCVEERAR
jgi:endonuclease/exonuclease/phosphatase family metal-dependent hydrolase